jgi:hypothetical protein
VLALLLPTIAFGMTLLLARFLLVLAATPAEPKRGTATPWLTAVALSLVMAWVVSPRAAAQALDLSNWLAAAAPVVLGVALAWVIARARPLGPPTRPAAIPAGDLLAWLQPLAELACRPLLAAAAWSDRRPAPRAKGATGVALAYAAGSAEDRLRHFAIAGSALVLLLTVIALTLWR